MQTEEKSFASRWSKKH